MLDQEPNKSIKKFPTKIHVWDFPTKNHKTIKGQYHVALHYNPIVKPCSSRLSMSHQGESLL